jgi:hypothetical protein
MGSQGVIFFRVRSAELPVERAREGIRTMALLVAGRPGDGSAMTYDLRFGIRAGEGGEYWVGFNALFWGNLFELVLYRHGVKPVRASRLPDGSQPQLRSALPRNDAVLIDAPLTEEEVKQDNVGEALEILGHAWRQRRRFRGR